MVVIPIEVIATVATMIVIGIAVAPIVIVFVMAGVVVVILCRHCNAVIAIVVSNVINQHTHTHTHTSDNYESKHQREWQRLDQLKYLKTRRKT